MTADTAKAAELAITAYLGLLNIAGPLSQEHLNKAGDLFDKALDWCDKQLSPILGQWTDDQIRKVQEAFDGKKTPGIKTVLPVTAPPGKVAATLKELFSWAIKHGKQYTPTWVGQQAKMEKDPTAATIAKVQAEIRTKMGWKD